MKGIGCFGIICIIFIIAIFPKIFLIPFIIIGLIFAIIWLIKYMFEEAPYIILIILIIAALIITK